MGIYLPGAGTLSCVVWPGPRITCFQGVPPDFDPPRVSVGLPVSPVPPLSATPRLLASLPFLRLRPPPTWMMVASLNPWLSDSIQLNFLTDLGVTCFEIYL